MPTPEESPISILERQILTANTRLMELRDREAEIASQIDNAKNNLRSDGVYAAEDWFRRANLALRKTRADIDLQQRSAKLLHRRLSYTRQQDYTTHFMTVAKNSLAPEVFAALQLETTKKCNTASGVL